MKKILFALTVFFYAACANACICARLGDNFFDTVNQHNSKVNTGEYPRADELTVVTGRVMAYSPAPKHIIPAAMQIKVGNVLQGKVDDKLIWVNGDEDGYQCRPAVLRFPLNTTYVFALQHDEKGQLFISGCGYYSLPTQSVPKG